MTFIVLESLADAFMSIGVFVFALAGAGSWLYRRQGPRLGALLSAKPRLGPLGGALATLPPGCMGVLAVARMYSSGHVSYGTILAAFLATMGDSAWLLMATHPMLTIALKLALVVLGTIGGMIADRYHVVQFTSATAEFASKDSTRRTVERTPDSPIPHPGVTLTYVTRKKALDAPIGRWARSAVALVSVVALPIAIGVAFRAMDEDQVPTWLGGPHAYLVLGSTGFAVCLIVMCRTASWRQCGECDPRTSSPWVAGVRESARVTVWAGAAFALWEMLASTTFFDSLSSNPLSGVVAVATAALLGLIPACGIELGVAALFVAGGLPAPALVTYLISQDGSGLIPLALTKPRAALLTTLITTATAGLAGLTLLAL